MKKVMIKDLKARDNLETIFLVKYSAVQEARDGRSYLNVILSDASGDLEAKRWQGAREAVKTLEKGAFVTVSGKVNVYQGRNQFIIEQYGDISEDQIKEHLGEKWRDSFIPKAKEDAQKMFSELCEHVEKLDEVYIRDLLKSIIFDPEVERRLKLWPAGKTIHHAYQSGLLEHVLSCVSLGMDLSKRYNVNQSYVVAGCLLHDICKIFELSDGEVVEYTEEGKLIGHLVKILEIIDYHASKIKDFPKDQKMHLKHIMLSHHGEYEYGSPKIPQTSEAMLVHLIDLMDSKMASFVEVKKNDKQVGRWSSFVRHLDRIVFKEELPSYKDYQDFDNSSKPKKTSGKEELTHSLAGALKGFKVDD